MALKTLITYSATFAAGALAFAAIAGAQGSFMEPVVSASSQPSSESRNSLVEEVEQVAPSNNTDDAAISESGQDSDAAPTSSQANAETDLTASDQTIADESGAVTNIADLQRNSRVLIEGVVTRASEEDEFVIEDTTGSVQVYTGSTFFVAEVGERVLVEGFVDESLLLEVYAQKVTHQDGRVTSITY